MAGEVESPLRRRIVKAGLGGAGLLVGGLEEQPPRVCLRRGEEEKR